MFFIILSRENLLIVFLYCRDSITVDSRIGGLESLREKGDTVLIHLIDGKILELHTNDMILSDSIVFPEFCYRLESINGHVIGLAASGRLYVDGKEILSAISSFVIHSDFLVVTSLQKHRLLCLPLAHISNSNLAITERAIERGAKLVHAVASETAVVLQMPRGNFEAIHPRALSLNIMKSLIDG
jgi:elongator complex protein 1